MLTLVPPALTIGCWCCLPAVRVPLYPFAAPVRDYSEMARRYTHMFVCPDLVKVVFNWAQVRHGHMWDTHTHSRELQGAMSRAFHWLLLVLRLPSFLCAICKTAELAQLQSTHVHELALECPCCCVRVGGVPRAWQAVHACDADTACFVVAG